MLIEVAVNIFRCILYNLEAKLKSGFDRLIDYFQDPQVEKYVKTCLQFCVKIYFFNKNKAPR